MGKVTTPVSVVNPTRAGGNHVYKTARGYKPHSGVRTAPSSAGTAMTAWTKYCDPAQKAPAKQPQSPGSKVVHGEPSNRNRSARPAALRTVTPPGVTTSKTPARGVVMPTKSSTGPINGGSDIRNLRKGKVFALRNRADGA